MKYAPLSSAVFILVAIAGVAGVAISQWHTTAYTCSDSSLEDERQTLETAIANPTIGNSVEPFGTLEQVGRTLYDQLVMRPEVYDPTVAVGLSPHILFHELDDPRNFDRRSKVKGLDEAGIVGVTNLQRWQDTYEKAKIKEKNRAGDHGLPPFQAWKDWLDTHPQYIDQDASGQEARGSAEWKHVSPLMPLEPEDQLPGMENPTYGEWIAVKMGQVAHQTTAPGVGLSDFYDSHPHKFVTEHDFNPRIIEQFESYLGQAIPGKTVTERADYIRAHHFSAWADFWSIGWGQWYASMAREVQEQTGKAPLIVDQNSRSPHTMRYLALDQRLILQQISSNNIVWGADIHTIGKERAGEDVFYSVGSISLFAAREPNARNGMNIHADTDRFWDGVDRHFDHLGNRKREYGMKLLKRLWFWTGWSHIMDRSGQTRRSVAYLERSYWDRGTVPEEWLQVLNSAVPTKPFGPALYYSVPSERQVETACPGDLYMDPKQVLALLKDHEAPLNYYISDAGLDAMTVESSADAAQSDYAPTAWVVLDRFNLLSEAEKQKMEAVAPILTASEAVKSHPSNGLQFPAGITGFGFWDQKDELIVVVSNLTNQAQTPDITLDQDLGAIAIDLETNEQLAIANNILSPPLERWDTRAFRLVNR